MGLNFTGQAFQEEENLFSVRVSCSNMKHLEVVLWEVPRFHAREGSNMCPRTVSCILHVTWQWRTEGGLGGSNPPRNSEVLTKLSRIPSSVENTSVTV
jgi:hypothetical protein